MTDLERTLQRIPEPEPPAGMAAVISARIAQADEKRVCRANSAAATAAASQSPGASVPSRLAWALAAAGLVVAVGAQAYLIAVGHAPVELLWPRISGVPQPPLQMLSVNPAVASMALGLALYLAGLLAPEQTGRGAEPPLDRSAP